MALRRQPATVRLRRLAAELRGLRQAAGLTREDVSEQTNINVASLYRIEAARVRPQKRTLLALLSLYGVTDEDRRDQMVDFSRQASQVGWLQEYESELPEEYAAYISFEAEARSVRNYESLFIPGLLQTESYARAVIAGAVPVADEAYVRRRVETRMRRQVALRKEGPLNLWAIVDEASLHRLVGNAEVMAEQLKTLAEVAAEPHVVIQVVPYRAGAHAGMPGSFALMNFPDPEDPELVFIDSMGGDLFLEREADIRRFTQIFEHLQAVALSPIDSTRLIREQAGRIG